MKFAITQDKRNQDILQCEYNEIVFVHCGFTKLPPAAGQHLNGQMRFKAGSHDDISPPSFLSLLFNGTK